MRTELVEKKRWISGARFLHALNCCMLLPGPEAQPCVLNRKMPSSLLFATAGAKPAPRSPFASARTVVASSSVGKRFTRCVV